jgi:hypothetical protein
MGHSRLRLCLLLFPQFLIASLPAVGDFGKELADVFDFLFRPDLSSAFSGDLGLGVRHLAFQKICNQGGVWDSEFPSGVERRIENHYSNILRNSIFQSQVISWSRAPLRCAVAYGVRKGSH